MAIKTIQRNKDGTFIKGLSYSPKTQFVKGMKMSNKVIEKRTKSVTGKKRPRQSILMRGAKCNFWKGGITPINNQIRNSYEYTLWRESVIKRDNYTCIWCGLVGGWNKEQKRKIHIHADHIKPFSLYPELRFAIDNGRTLCFECHQKTDTFGKKIINYAKNINI